MKSEEKLRKRYILETTTDISLNEGNKACKILVRQKAVVIGCCSCFFRISVIINVIFIREVYIKILLYILY